MSIKYVTLGEICDKGSSNIAQKDLAEREGQYPIYGAAGLIKNVDFAHQKQPYIAVVKDGAGIGRVMKLPAYSSVIGTMQYILPKENVDIGYLFYALQHMNLGKYFSGSTIPHIYFRDYQKERLKLPTLKMQQCQAETLSRIDALSSFKQRQLVLLDNIVKSRFVEMFGEPVTNSRTLPTMRGDKFFKLSNGKFVPESKRFETGIPVYGGNGVSWYTDDTLVSGDTIVVGRVGFQSGNVHYANGPLWVSDNAMYVSGYDASKFDLLFLCHLMDHIDFTRHQDAGDLKKITQKPFMTMEYIHPLLSKQREYIAFVAQVDKSKLAVKQGLEKLEMLKKSLMQQYFE